MKRGFTLIELMVVMSVVSVLATAISTAVSSVRTRSRDSIRKQSLTELRTALELYHSTYNQYPFPGEGNYWYSSNPGGDPPNEQGGFLNGNDNNGDWIPGLVASGAIAKLPQDPKGGKSDIQICTTHNNPLNYYRSFTYQSTNGTGYKLLSHCAPEGSMSNSDPFYDPIRSNHAWMVCVDGNSGDCSL